MLTSPQLVLVVASYVGQTNHQPDRVKLTAPHWKKSRTFARDTRETWDEQAEDALISAGLRPVGVVDLGKGDDFKGFILAWPSHSEPFMYSDLSKFFRIY